MFCNVAFSLTSFEFNQDLVEVFNLVFITSVNKVAISAMGHIQGNRIHDIAIGTY